MVEENITTGPTLWKVAKRFIEVLILTPKRAYPKEVLDT